MKKKDLTGQKFGMLTALRSEKVKGLAGWLCRCDCGEEKFSKTNALTSGANKSCGCALYNVSHNRPVEIDQAYLISRLTYSEVTGLFFWKARAINDAGSIRIQGIWNKNFAGKQAGSIHKASGYSIITINNKRYKAHRLAWLYVHGRMPSEQVDHIDHNRANNKINNLRLADASTNARNTKLPSRNKSGIIGVSFCNSRNRWRATISNGGKAKTLGYFHEKSKAAKARKSAEVEYGYHQNHGML